MEGTVKGGCGRQQKERHRWNLRSDLPVVSSISFTHMSVSTHVYRALVCWCVWRACSDEALGGAAASSPVLSLVPSLFLSKRRNVLEQG